MEISNEDTYIRHLIECQCILKIYEKRTKPLFHKFPVFSIISNDDIIEKYAECNNCGSIHRVYDVQESEIMWGKDGYEGLVTKIDDIRNNLENTGHQKIVEILTTHKIDDVSLWENVEFLLENNASGMIILNKNSIKDNDIYKILYIDKGIFKIKNEVQQRLV